MTTRGSRVRSVRPVKRASALVLATAIGALCPGPVPPLAVAQTTAPTDGGGYYATPPPVDLSALPADTGKPDKNYEPKRGCVTRDLDRDITLREKPWGQQFLRIDEVHKLMRGTVGSAGKYRDGTPVRVAVIDTGITGSHPFFEGRVKPGGEYVYDSGEPGMEDCDGHGTEVAGIIAADTPPEIGFTGVAPDVEILSFRQSSENYGPDKSGGGGDSGAGKPGEPGTGTAQLGRTQEGSDTAGSLDTLAQAVRRAADMGADVVNISINACRPAGGPITTGERKLQAAVRYAVEQKDVVVVAAAGNIMDTCPQNDQQDPDKPRSIVTPPWFSEDVLSVAAIDHTGGVAEFSIHGPWVSVAAPGTNIISLDPVKGSEGLANLTVEGNGDPQPIKGTSFAAPYVSGLAALVRAKYPELSAREVMHRIMFTAHHPAAEGGRDNFTGYGTIDPMAALTATVPSEQGLKPAAAEALPSDLPPADNRDWTPVTVALVGSGGAIVALLITLFVMHTVRRNRTKGA